MRSKTSAVNPQRASAANKPFMTEYRLAFRDPTIQKRKNATTKVASRKANGAKPAAKSEPIKETKPIAAQKVEEKQNDNVPHHSTSLTLPAMINGNKNSLEAYRQRRRLLAAEHKQSLHQRYNIINGSAIEGELSSGFKEGRRAIVQTFSHIDTITNARSPGYNIITGHDALSGKTSDEIQKVYGNLTKAAH